MPTFTRNTVPGNQHAIVGVADKGIGVHGTSNTSTGTGGVSGSGIGVHGVSKAGPGVRGDAENGVGVFGKSKDKAGVVGESDKLYGVVGESIDGVGVYGSSRTDEAIHGVTDSVAAAAVIGINNSTGPGIRGVSQGFDGVSGESQGSGKAGVAGFNANGVGVWGSSTHGEGVHAETNSPAAAAVIGINNSTGPGIRGVSQGFDGVSGESQGHGKAGVAGFNANGVGVWGSSTHGAGVHAETNALTVAAIAGYNNNPLGTGAAVYGKKAGDTGHAGFFDGNVHVTRDITLSNADCAEHFDVADMATAEPGTVMVLGEKGLLYPSQNAYDKRVAGVVSGAGDYRPGIVLDKRRSSPDRKPIALLGKVVCKADASLAQIGVGDLLTTSDVPGHAMKAVDPASAFGAVIGKALRPLAAGQGLIPILVTLQ